MKKRKGGKVEKRTHKKRNDERGKRSPQKGKKKGRDKRTLKVGSLRAKRKSWSSDY